MNKKLLIGLSIAVVLIILAYAFTGGSANENIDIID